MRIAFYTLGCKVNQYETEILANRFANDGFDIVDIEDEADVYVINSCTVTASGDKKTKQVIRRFKRVNPNAIVALTGCFPQAFPDEANLIPEADIIQGSYNRAALLPNVKKALQTRERIVDITPHQKGEAFEPMKATRFMERTRAFVKIEDGCDRYCNYCIIPKARGPIRSKTIEDIQSEVTGLVQNGYKEFVLVGINLSSYGKDMEPLRLIDAIEAVSSINGVERVRLGSLEPELLSDDDLMRMSKIPQFCDQFHLSLQSGCDQTLKRMNRHYDSAEYYEIVSKIRSIFDNPAITTDIMVGFAGETEQEFEASLAFAKKVQFAKAHVFAYSIRQGTKAATMENQVDKHTKENRSKQMIEVTKLTQQDFLKTQIGTTQEVLFETPHGENEYVGYTKNYTKVIVKSNENICGEIKTVTLSSAYEEHCQGEIL
ncbi:tRNA (N(6)-L-threonylcarbamoyladenosine(37)-C(2))-methylthiotransferase MtaB [Paludicola sp. MB14-C6]|uniref:tRNA (N(6)-L-threonylcarbamoyladenosine(37)-C(2))- methylthiotransferase MtaB n=1 Tax=Paludihabitans sp. MB14-C6 TaxID=3070656 RepID=UPI0027DC2491|nr:tRNA (N(6)-L-threonylcarbamoyladenosine(37)-C(2))-methylthiotransferase MtaB [Paludicola sp. MB14-C6]WMJ22290.1 tRNA (N(6)-L-threonylcarbamoyladenosine(37)-C(2))-methylthiotransferase MtaB [Paludicola sp. MB14-C6]